jgi:two-component sensor histidine kinase
LHQRHQVRRLVGSSEARRYRLDAERCRATAALTWTETNGPTVKVPEERSFGTRLIETLGQQLKGDVKLAYAPTGFIYLLDVPLTSLTLATI